MKNPVKLAAMTSAVIAAGPFKSIKTAKGDVPAGDNSRTLYRSSGQRTASRSTTG
jgi:hypothetical protein